MHLVVPHTFSQKDATVRLKTALAQGRSQIAQQVVMEEEVWDDNTLRFRALLQGKTISGTLEVKEKEYVLDAQLPLLWRMFEGKIERAIAEQVKSLQ